MSRLVPLELLTWTRLAGISRVRSAPFNPDSVWGVTLTAYLKNSSDALISRSIAQACSG